MAQREIDTFKDFLKAYGEANQARSNRAFEIIHSFYSSIADDIRASVKVYKGFGIFDIPGLLCLAFVIYLNYRIIHNYRMFKTLGAMPKYKMIAFGILLLIDAWNIHLLVFSRLSMELFFFGTIATGAFIFMITVLPILFLIWIIYGPMPGHWYYPGNYFGLTWLTDDIETVKDAFPEGLVSGILFWFGRHKIKPNDKGKDAT